MSEYMPNVFLGFKHPPPICNQDSPHACARVVYVKSQYPMQEESSPKLPPNGIQHVQKVVGSLLYYNLAVGCTLLVALSELALAHLMQALKLGMIYYG